LSSGQSQSIPGEPPIIAQPALPRPVSRDARASGGEEKDTAKGELI